MLFPHLPPDRELHGITEPELTGDDKLLTFDSFSKNSVKNRVLTVREVFLMQLTRIPKISQDKAEAIIEVFSIVFTVKLLHKIFFHKNLIIYNIIYLIYYLFLMQKMMWV